MTIPTSALEIWNSVRHSYESIPDTNPLVGGSEDSFSAGEEDYSWKAKSKSRPKHRWILVTVVVALACTCSAGFYWRSTIAPQALEIKTLPTLLSVVDPDTNHYVYVKENELYQNMRGATYVDAEESEWSGQELPKLLLDKTQIQIDESITLAWTMGRDLESGNVMLSEDDIIALYCGEKTEGDFLEAATIAQVRATSIRNGGYHDSWFIPSFPILREDACHFRLYKARNTTTTSSMMTFTSFRLIHMASSDTLEISLAKETPTAVHLALSEDSSKMVVQFTTGYYGGEAVPVVRYVKAAAESSSSSTTTTEEYVLLQGTSDTYTAEDLCEAPANLTEAGTFYPPGMLHIVELEHLEHDTIYNYQVGLREEDESVLVWSDLYSFTSAPKEGDLKEFSYIVYGDQGCPEEGWAEGQKWLTTMMQRENPTVIHHFGDISVSHDESEQGVESKERVRHLTSSLLYSMHKEQPMFGMVGFK
jgi:hypothetical protein